MAKLYLQTAEAPWAWGVLALQEILAYKEPACAPAALLERFLTKTCLRRHVPRGAVTFLYRQEYYGLLVVSTRLAVHQSYSKRLEWVWVRHLHERD